MCVQELQQQAAAHASALQQLLASQQALLGQLGAGGELGGRLAALAAQQEALADQVQQLAAQVSALTLPALLPCLGSSCVECERHGMFMCAACLVLLTGRVRHVMLMCHVPYFTIRHCVGQIVQATCSTEDSSICQHAWWVACAAW
jgi:hypothetical protein